MSRANCNDHGFPSLYKVHNHICPLALRNEKGDGKHGEYVSVRTYLHLVKGVDIPVLRPVIIEQLIKGKRNLENIEKRQNQKPVRAPITLTSMKLLKIGIKNWDSSRFNKAMVWTVCTTAFAGCLRIHELLCKKVETFEPDFTLLKADIKLNRTEYKGSCIKVIQLRLKSPKEDRIGRGKIIDVYESEGPLCPVRAMERWYRLQNQTVEELPAFRWENGKCFTGKQLNKLLRLFLEPHLDYTVENVIMLPLERLI